MAKTILEKIEAKQQEILQKQKEEKQLRKRYNEEQRKARTHRLCNRHGLFEKMLPDTIALTDEQFKTFLEKTVANEHGRRMLAKLTAQDSTTTVPLRPATSPQAAPACSGGDGGEPKEG